MRLGKFGEGCGELTFDECFRPKFWSDLRFFALVKPKKHILPVRMMYDGSTPNIGNNYLTSAKPIWIAGPDLIASAIQTGSAPEVVRAIRIVPRGKQKLMGRVSCAEWLRSTRTKMICSSTR